MPHSRPSADVVRVIDFFLPAGARSPEDTRRFRFLIGAAELGFAVSVVSIGIQLAIGPPAPAVVISLFGLGLAVVLGLVKAGVGLDTLRPATLGLLGAFLCAVSLMTTKLEWRQLYWLILLPLASLFMDHVKPADARQGLSRVAVPARASALAAALGLLVVTLNHWGYTFGLERPPDSTQAAEIADFLMFVVSVSGLLGIHHVALMQAEEDAALLRSMLAVCAWCRKIRDEVDGWMPLERYMARHTTTQLSHGICPECKSKSFADTCNAPAPNGMRIDKLHAIVPTNARCARPRPASQAPVSGPH